MERIFIENEDFDAAARKHAAAFPLLEARDLIKLAYQHARGCEHMVEPSPYLRQRIAEERRGRGVRFESIGNGLVRAHLEGDAPEMSSELLARMFVYSARGFSAGEDVLPRALRTLEELAARGRLPVDGAALSREITAYRAAGCPAVHHSDAFREAYQPHYRVMTRLFSDYAALFSALEKLKNRHPGAIVAIDGMCASGKTTLANAIRGVLDAEVYHMDDFFLRPEQRTAARFAEAGGNVDRERFLEEVLAPLAGGKDFQWRPFDCGKMALGEKQPGRRAPLNIVEGAYSCHPDLIAHYDLTVCLSVEEDLQRARILQRNGENLLKRFEEEWIPMEERYLSAFSLRERAGFSYLVGAKAQ